MKNKKSFGFTLVEVLVVMTIIAILTGISLVAFDGVRKTARDGKRKADLESIRSALEIYRTDCKTYPEDSELIFDGASSLVGPTANTFCHDVEYMETIPSDSNPLYSYYYVNQGANSYILCAHLEGSTADDNAICGSNCTTDTTAVACNYAVNNP